MSRVTFPRSIKEMPKQKHFAVIKFGSIYIPGDERSRTNPGHGYPASFETTMEYIAFENKESVEEWIKLNGETTFTVLYVTPVSVKKEVKISIEEM
jgi:hypothetical protein